MIHALSTFCIFISMCHFGQNRVHDTHDASNSASASDGKPFQYVSFAFDGSRSLSEWRKTIDFAKEMRKTGHSFYFTYFINAIYLVPRAQRNIYHPPHQVVGGSAIGYGTTRKEVGERIALINEAYADGNEIGSHSVGHFPGVGWSEKDWTSEFTQFDAILESKRNGVDTDVKLEVPKSAITGFRAPDLAAGKNLDRVLDVFGFAYDGSYTAKIDAWPYMRGAHMELPLASIPFAGRTILCMDYNFYVHTTQAKDMLKKGTPEWQKEHGRILDAYVAYFEHNYTGNRAPVFIAHHFSEWNDGLYSEVMQDAAKAICTKPFVKCETYADTMEYSKWYMNKDKK
jgi:hypothetical protein